MAKRSDAARDELHKPNQRAAETVPTAQDAQGLQPAQGAAEAQEGLIVDNKHKAHTNPAAPDFDPVEWQKAIDEAGGMDALADGLKEALHDEGLQRSLNNEREFMTLFGEYVAKTLRGLPTADDINEMSRALLARMSEVKPILQHTLNAAMDAITPTLKTLSENADTLREIYDNWQILAPYMDAETAEHPEIYGDDEHPERGENVPLETLIAAAARRARADGIDLPPLKAEATEDGEAQADEKAAEAPALDLPLFQAFLPQTHISPNSLLANRLTGETSIINRGMGKLPVANRGGRHEIDTIVTVTHDIEKGVVLKGPVLTEYDRQVYDGICSIWEYGHENKMLTPDTVYRAMTGTDKQPSPQQREAITQSIEKWRRTFAKVDATEEMTAYLKRRRIDPKPGTVFKWDNTMLSLSGLEVVNGGHRQKVYKFDREPLLLSYSKATGKVLTSPTSLLDIKEISETGEATGPSIDNTEGRIAIKGYLWRRVLVMKHDLVDARKNFKKYETDRKRHPDVYPAKPLTAFCKQSHSILFDTLFKETGQTSDNRAIQRRNRDYVFQVLDYWRAENHIAGYKKKTGPRNAITGVEIEF